MVKNAPLWTVQLDWDLESQCFTATGVQMRLGSKTFVPTSLARALYKVDPCEYQSSGMHLSDVATMMSLFGLLR